MPKCLECGNTAKFSYTESARKIGEYNSQGELIDVENGHWDKVTDGECDKCESKNIEGDL